MADWHPGDPCRVVEHSAGKPLPGGREYPAAVTSAVGEFVHATAESGTMPGMLSLTFHAGSGWLAGPGEGEFRWRLLPAAEDAVAAECSIARSRRSRPLRGGGPGLARVRGAGFLFHRPLPGLAGSYTASAGVYPLRPTGGEHEAGYGPRSRTARGNTLTAAWFSPPSAGTIARSRPLASTVPAAAAPPAATTATTWSRTTTRPSGGTTGRARTGATTPRTGPLDRPGPLHHPCGPGPYPIGET